MAEAPCVGQAGCAGMSGGCCSECISPQDASSSHCMSITLPETAREWAHCVPERERERAPLLPQPPEKAPLLQKPPETITRSTAVKQHTDAMAEGSAWMQTSNAPHPRIPTVGHPCSNNIAAAPYIDALSAECRRLPTSTHTHIASSRVECQRNMMPIRAVAASQIKGRIQYLLRRAFRG